MKLLVFILCLGLLCSCGEGPEPDSGPYHCWIYAENLVTYKANIIDGLDAREFYSANKELDSYTEHSPFTYENTYIQLSIVCTHNIKWKKDICDKLMKHNEFPDQIQNKYLYENRTGADVRYNLYPRFCTSTVYDRVTITADKELFGMPAGSILNDHFEVMSTHYVLLGGELGNFSVLYDYNSMPSSMEQYFTCGVFMPSSFILKMKDYPDECYDAIDFTINLPIQKEFWYNYYAEKAHNKKATLKKECVVVSAQCTLRLGDM